MWRSVLPGCARCRTMWASTTRRGVSLRVSVLAVADELAAAAELVMGKLDRVPAAIVRGYPYQAGPGSARELLRRPDLDMFR